MSKNSNGATPPPMNQIIVPLAAVLIVLTTLGFLIALFVKAATATGAPTEVFEFEQMKNTLQVLLPLTTTALGLYFGQTVGASSSKAANANAQRAKVEADRSRQRAEESRHLADKAIGVAKLAQQAIPVSEEDGEALGTLESEDAPAPRERRRATWQYDIEKIEAQLDSLWSTPVLENEDGPQ